jgi:hypothetical protein
MSALPVVQGISPGLRAFVVNDTSQVAFWSIQGQIANLDSTFYRGRLDVPVGISISQPPGRVILLGYPSRAMPSPANLALNKRPLARLLFGTSGLLAP